MEGSISIKLDFGSTKLDMTFEPSKKNVVALFAFINSQMALADDDPNTQIIAGFSNRLQTVNDQTENALGA